MKVGGEIIQKENVLDDYGTLWHFEWDGVVTRIEKTFYEVEFSRDRNNLELHNLVIRLLRDGKLANNHRTYEKMRIKNYSKL